MAQHLKAPAILLAALVAHCGAPAHAAPGDLLVQLSVSSDSLVRVNPLTGAQSLVAVTTADPLRTPFFITLAPDGTAYRFLHSFVDPTTSRIERVDLTTGAASIVASNINTWNLGGAGFVVEPSGSLLFTGYGGRNVQRINPTTGQVSVVLTAATNHAFYGGITDAAGQIYLIDQFGGLGTLKRFDPVTLTATTIVASSAFQQADDMAFSSDGSALFIVNRFINGVRRVDLASGTLTTIAGSLDGALGLATGPGNTLYAGVSGQRLVSIDTTNGSAATITSGSLLAGRMYGLVVEVPAPGGIAFVIAGGTAAFARRRGTRPA
jgi:streptogramin lyase